VFVVGRRSLESLLRVPFAVVLFALLLRVRGALDLGESSSGEKVRGVLALGVVVRGVDERDVLLRLLLLLLGRGRLALLACGARPPTRFRSVCEGIPNAD